MIWLVYLILVSITRLIKVWNSKQIKQEQYVKFEVDVVSFVIQFNKLNNI
jgi:hypothetical protein